MNLHEIPRTGGAGWLTPMQQTRYEIDYLEAKEFHAARVRFLVVAVMEGALPYCIGWIQPKGEAARLELRMSSSDLQDAIGLTDAPDLIGKLFASAFSRECKASTFGEAEDMLAAYIDKTADLLAKREAQS